MGAMVFSNILLVFMMSFQFGMYDLMIENTLKIFTGHVQVQAPGYKDDQKMRQTVPNVIPLAEKLRLELASQKVAARAQAFAVESGEMFDRRGREALISALLRAFTADRSTPRVRGYGRRGVLRAGPGRTSSGLRESRLWSLP